MNTCPNCGLTRGLHSSILPGCMCQYEVQLPQKKEWVGLTDKEIMQCYEDVAWDSDQSIWLDFGENVQAKLKEKNNG